MPITIQNDFSADPLETADINLVAALMAVGFEPLGMSPVRVITKASRGGQDYNFSMPEVSACGKYHVRELIKAWKAGREWVEKNPDHPFAYAMATTANHRALVRRLRHGERQVFMQSGKSVAMLPENASQGLEEKILGNF